MNLINIYRIRFIIISLLIFCCKNEPCISHLKFVTKTLGNKEYKITSVELINNNWVYNNNLDNIGSRFLYDIYINNKIDTVLIKKEPINIKNIDFAIENAFKEFLQRFLNSKNPPQIQFDIITKNYSVINNRNELTSLICNINNIVTKLKTKMINKGYDKTLINSILCQRYVIYEEFLEFQDFTPLPSK